MFNIKTIAIFVAVLVIAYGAYTYFATDKVEAPASIAPAQTEAVFGDPVQYSCAEEKVLVAWFGNNVAKVALTEDQIYTLEQISVDEEDNTKFANENDQMVLWIKDQSAFLEQNGTTTYAACRTL